MFIINNFKIMLKYLKFILTKLKNCIEIIFLTIFYFYPLVVCFMFFDSISILTGANFFVLHLIPIYFLIIVIFSTIPFSDLLIVFLVSKAYKLNFFIAFIICCPKLFIFIITTIFYYLIDFFKRHLRIHKE